MDNPTRSVVNEILMDKYTSPELESVMFTLKFNDIY